MVYAAIVDLRTRARALDDTAGRLASRIGSVGWEGAAASAMRSRAHDALADLKRCAQLHDEAAAALERHRQAALANPLGGAVQGVMHAIGSIL